MMLSRVACTRVTGRVAREKDVKDIFSLTPQAWAPSNLLPLCGTLAATKVVQPWALSSRWPSLLGGGVYQMSPLLALTSTVPLLPPRPSGAPALTVLSTQATERPAKRLATPRATLTSSLRTSSHRLLRNLNNLSVYVATPGERERERWVDSGQGTRSLFRVLALP